jgi:hypothetical protein
MKRFLGLLLVVASFQSPHLPAQSLSTQPAQLLPAATTIAGQSPEGNPDVKVWVNTNSGVYHCPGTRWYGATKHGEYMTQAEAQKKRYRPAYGKVCR